MRPSPCLGMPSALAVLTLLLSSWVSSALGQSFYAACSGSVCLGAGTVATYNGVSYCCPSGGTLSGGGSSWTCAAYPQACGSYDPTAWLGSYSGGGCDTTQCCCAATVTIGRTNGDSTYLITGTNLVGSVCPSAATSMVTTVLLPTSNTATFTLASQPHQAVLNENIISDRNLAAPACSSTLVRKTSGGTNAGTGTNSGAVGATTPIPTAALLLSALGAIVAATR